VRKDATLTCSEPLLVVDDEPDMCWALERILNKNGYVIKKALNGVTAIALMREHAFPLALVDAKLPDVDGLELAREMRRLAPAMSIIMVSGYFYRDDVAIQQALSQGLIKDFISKPFQQEEILLAIQI
jgi:DNA-binding NtrC family response regulator